MATRRQLDAIHASLDQATLALGDLIEARVTSNDAKAQDAINRLSTDLGATKFALRELPITEKASGMPDAQADPRRRWIEHAAEVRSKAQETMVTVASGALALTVTFREALMQSFANGSWLLKTSWIAFVVCVVFVLIERFISSMRFTVHAVRGSSPTRREKVVLAALHVLSQIGFAVGIVGMASFGWVNL